MYGCIGFAIPYQSVNGVFFFSIGWSIHRVVVGGARVGEGGDGEGGGWLGNRKLYFVSCSYLDRNYTLPVLPLWILRRGK